MNRRSAFFAAGVAFLLALGHHLLFGDLYLNLRDEGYLWYGVEAVRAGDVPLRDFQAYDPGRYYWCAWLAPLFGDGLIGIRGAVALFQALGLTCALLAARRVLARDFWLVPVGLLLMCWSFPRFKLFESALTAIGVWALLRVFERPSARRQLVLGLVVGGAACFGRNHGLYLGLASLAGLGVQWFARREEVTPRRVGALAGGVLLGYAPQLVMLAVVPGYAAAFGDAVLSVLSRGANLPQPFPWSWRPALAEHGLLGGVVLQLGFLLPVVLLPLGVVSCVARRRRPEQHALLFAATIVGAIYVHHYSVRADPPHLAQAIFPVLLLGVALGAEHGPRTAAAAAVLLLGHGTLLALGHHPEVRHYAPWRERPPLATFEVRGEELRLKAGLTRHLERVRRMLDQALDPSDELFVAPTRPTFYPLFGKRSPTWWIYFLWPATADEQAETMRRLADGNVNWALIVEKSFTDDPAYDFRNTNPLVWEHLQRDWILLDAAIVPEDYYLFRRR